MAASLDASRALGGQVSSSSVVCLSRASCRARSAAMPPSSFITRISSNFCRPPSPLRHARPAKPRDRAWRNLAKATGADPNNYSSLEFMDPQTGEYRNVEIPTEEEGAYDVEGEEETNGENDEELLRSFAAAIGLDDQDMVGTLFNKMRNPTSDTIVKQLEEGIGDVEDLLKDMYRDNPDIEKLYTKVEYLIGKGDERAARDIIEANYEALLEQLHEGIFGVGQVSMFNILASLYMHLGDEDATDQLLGQAKELLELMPDDEKSVGSVLEHTAFLYMKLKSPRQALPLFKRSISVKKASGGDIPSIVRTMIGLANTYTELEQVDKSTELYRQILAYSEEALGSDDEDLAAPLMHLGSSLLEEGKLNEAEVIIERALKLTEKAFGGKDGRYGVALCILAQIKGTKGELEKALEWFLKGLQVMEGSNDFKEDSALNTVRMDIAALLNVMGREKESQDVLKKADAQDNQRYQYFLTRQVEYLQKVAEQYAAEGEVEMAERALRRTLQLLVTHLGPDAIQVSIVLQLLATLLHSQPDREFEAEPLVRESIRIREKKFGRHHIAVGEACCYLASILHYQEQDEEAVDLMYRVLEIQENEFGFDNPQLEETLDVLNMLLMNLGRYQETVPIVNRLEQMKAQSGSSFDV